ncbi:MULTISPECIES: DUF2975 domain-containing protein [Brevibacterium]|uniref:DUF2975 domain-containing protein n=1 Tax=Brevibacterium antiquum CNRZ 918 TaxID=1255637 RepID=A0A2H1IY11_9MICO|nr:MULTISPECIES: DUF2975 domain-containing protein [Brevibacterium]SMX80097.1 hypothetical protein BANT918_01202 [Brevibacterium antiquum CNRZ 918]HCG56432.1 DUF2975 domain-containing protein [Brevibacterium sp.]
MSQGNEQNERPGEAGRRSENDDTVIGNLKGGAKSPGKEAKRKAFGTGYELWVGLAIGFYVVYAVTELITDLVHSEIKLPLEFESDSVGMLDFPSAAASLSGLTQITVSTSDLAPETMVFLIIAKIAVILIFLGAAIAIVPVIRAISAGAPFTARSIGALVVLEWIVAVGFALYFLTMLLGSNLVSRDLGIAQEVGPGITTMQAFLVLGVIGGAELLRRCFKSGRAAQEELEGLV